MTQRDMRRAFARAAIGVVVIVALAVGGVWLWGRPRSHVPQPTAQTSPTDVVHAYEKALRDRDFAGAASLTVAEPVQEHWWSWNAPWFQIAHLDGTSSGGGRPLKTYGPADSWEQAAEVRTTSTLHNFSGFHETRPDEPWNFILVRHTSTEPWRIISQGQG